MKNWLWYSVAALLPLLLLVPILRLDKADLSVPFQYELTPNPEQKIQPSGSGDAYFVMMLFRTMSLTGSVDQCKNVGAPYGLDMRDHPILDSLQLNFARLLCMVTGDYGLALNLFYLLGYAATSLSMMFTLRCLGITRPLALAAAIAYTFLPYHFYRSESHLFLGFYAAVPLGVLTAIWLSTGQLEGGKGPRRRATVKRRRWIALLAVVLVSCSGAYYALFALYAFVVAGLVRAWQRRTMASAGMALSVVATAGLVIAANAVPFLLYEEEVGANPAAVLRHPAQAEVFAFRPIQLLLPIEEHRLTPLADIAETYNSNAMLINENRMASLGLTSAAGFVLLLLWLIGLRWRTARPRLMTSAAQMNFALLALGTFGGIGSILAFYGSPVFRSYGRVSVLIAVVALLATMLAIQTWTRRRPGLVWSIAIALILLAAFDQTSDSLVPLHEQNAASYASDRAFVREIEKALPPGAMVLQFPRVEFPEAKSPGPYELFRPYLHSESLRWSFGAMKGREGDELTRAVTMSMRDPQAFRESLRNKGYQGIYLDRALDEERKYENYLRGNINANPLESANHRLLFFRAEQPARS